MKRSSKIKCRKKTPSRAIRSRHSKKRSKKQPRRSKKQPRRSKKRSRRSRKSSRRTKRSKKRSRRSRKSSRRTKRSKKRSRRQRRSPRTLKYKMFDYSDISGSNDFSQIQLNPEDLVNGLKDLWGFISTGVDEPSTANIEEVIEIPVVVPVVTPAVKSKQAIPAAKSKQAVAVPASKSKQAVVPAAKSKQASGAVGVKPAGGKKAKKVVGAVSDTINWAGTFSICNILSGVQFSKYPKMAQEKISQLPAMVNREIGRELKKYMSDPKSTSILEYMSIFSRNDNYPAYYLYWILKLVPDIDYNYIPWLGTKNVFDGVDTQYAVLSDEGCFVNDRNKMPDIKTDPLTRSYSGYILTVLFDILARYRYVYGEDSPKILKIKAYKDSIDKYRSEFSDTADKLSCPSYTSALLAILKANPSCRGGSKELGKCQYSLENLDILRKLVYRCVGNIKKLRSTLPESDQRQINIEIRDELKNPKYLEEDDPEIQQLEKNLVIFQKYSDHLNKIYEDVARSEKIAMNENIKMSKQLPDGAKRKSAILFLGLLIRALREGNSNFIDTLADEELVVDDNGNVELVADTNSSMPSLLIETQTKELLNKYIPKSCTGTHSADAICQSANKATQLKTTMKEKLPIPGSKKAGPTLPSSLKKDYISDKLNTKVMNNLAIQMARVSLEPQSYDI